MNIQKIYEELINTMPELEIKLDEEMSKHTSFKVGGKSDIFIKIKTIEELKEIIKYTELNRIPLTVLGNGSNVIVKDNGIRGITIQLAFTDIEIVERENNVIITVGSGVKLGMLAVMLYKKEIEGFEFASRNTWNNRWGNSNECRSLWKRNAGNCSNCYMYR